VATFLIRWVNDEARFYVSNAGLILPLCVIEIGSGSKEGSVMTGAVGKLRFLSDWGVEQIGSLEREGQLVIEYDKNRCQRCFTTWRGAEFGDIEANVRFHPRGELFRGTVVAPVRQSENGPVIGHVPTAFELSVPSYATQVEIWFHNFYQTTSRCDAWDSRFGQNYWFDIGGEPPRG